MKLFHNKHFIFSLTAVLVFVFDLLTKHFVKNSMTIGQKIVLLPFLHLTYLENTGAGFGLLKEFTTAFIFVALIVIGLILYYYDKLPKKKRYVWVATALIFGGAIANAVSRIVEKRVIDFIDLRIWPVFNIADAALTVGVILLIVYFVKKK